MNSRPPFLRRYSTADLKRQAGNPTESGLSAFVSAGELAADIAYGTRCANDERPNPIRSAAWSGRSSFGFANAEWPTPPDG